MLSRLIKFKFAKVLLFSRNCVKTNILNPDFSALYPKEFDIFDL